jgi:broad specificity phosphatase PhoE
VTARRVLLWRHGRTEWNATGRVQGQIDVPLDEVGVEQAAEAAPLLAAEKPDLIISSDLSRAYQTAQALSAVTGLPVQTDPRLRETAFGPWEGLTHAEIEAGWPEDFDRWRAGGEVGLPGSESPADVVARMTVGLRDALPQTDGTIVLVTHGGAARRAVQALTGWGDDVAALIAALGNCRWTEMRPGRNGWRLHAHNLGPLTGAAGVDAPSTAVDAEAGGDEPAAGQETDSEVGSRGRLSAPN